MFFIQKEAIYYHGVFWIGESEEEGRKEVRRLAEADIDDHHNWVLYEFIPGQTTSTPRKVRPEHRKILSVKKHISDYSI